ncbi:MAG: glycosyltransferase family 2 protein [Bacteroidia bacterium]|nr:glycosyltransferase family 2 protein [Bacteroidia bacterium]MCO5254575.1 glycosyltransferase family 2 protein [Bacteroidota bacterium]
MKKLSLVVPVYFEEECILQYLKETIPVLSALGLDWEIVFVDDGSKDKTVELIKEEATKENRIKLVEFSYNQGKQAAVSAGIRYATGDYLLYMDPDLQDPPDEIPHFVREIEQGYDLVFGVRKEKIDSTLNKLYSKIFWGTLNKFTGLEIPKGLAVMRIFNRKFADKFLEYAEQNRFIEGIFIHIGMKRTQIEVSQRKRFAGRSKFNFKRKMQLAFDAIFDFSELPLKLAVKLGMFFSLFGLVALVLLVILKLFFIDFELGWPSLISAIILGFGIQLFFIGIAAIYIGKIYKESKRRPLYSIKDLTNL